MSLLIKIIMDCSFIFSLPMEKSIAFSEQLPWNIMILLCLKFSSITYLNLLNEFDVVPMRTLSMLCMLDIYS